MPNLISVIWGRAGHFAQVLRRLAGFPPSVHKRMLILANSMKGGGGRCIAGREMVADGSENYQLGPWLRPISSHGQGELCEAERLYANGSPVSVLDIVDVRVSEKLADACQPENWRIASRARWLNAGEECPRPSLSTLEERPASLWLQPGERTDRVAHGFLSANPPEQSLYIIRPEKLRLSFQSQTWGGVTKRQRRCLFQYNGVEYALSLTDPVIGQRFESQFPEPSRPPLILRLPCGDDALICVSLAGDFHGHHYKVAATLFEGTK